MGVWFGRRAQRQVPTIGLGGPSTPIASEASYQNFTLDRWDTSLQSVAVGAAVDLIASIASELPVRVYRGEGSARRRLDVPRWLRDPGGDGYGLQDWSYRAVMSWLMRGNLFGEVLERDRARGHLRQVELFHPDTVSGWMDDGEPRWMVSGRRVERDFLHRRVLPVPGQILGRSPIAYHASTIGVSLASTAFGLQWFRDGAHPSGLLTNSETSLNKEQADTAKSRFLAALRGRREPVVLGKGWSFSQLQINPEESQFLETQQYSAAECARIFGPGIAEVLGYGTQQSMTYSNIQDRDLHLLKYALNRWLRRLERLLSDFLPEPQYVQLNRDALLQTNTLARYQAHASALDKRWRTVNEVRELEDLPPVEWGDEPNPTPGAGGGSQSANGDSEGEQV